MTLQEINNALRGLTIFCHEEDSMGNVRVRPGKTFLKALPDAREKKWCWVQWAGEERKSLKRVEVLEELIQTGECVTHRDNRDERRIHRETRCFPLPPYESYKITYMIQR